MRLIRNLLALLVLAVGALWSLQGLGFVRGSFMTDQAVWLYIGIVTMLVSSRNQRLGDLAAGTVVVHEKGLSAPVMTVAAPAAGVAWTGGGLTEAELLLVETFLQRRHEIDPVIRETHAHAIAERLRARLGTSAPALDAEPLIEALHARARTTGRVR